MGEMPELLKLEDVGCHFLICFFAGCFSFTLQNHLMSFFRQICPF